MNLKLVGSRGGRTKIQQIFEGVSVTSRVSASPPYPPGKQEVNREGRPSGLHRFLLNAVDGHPTNPEFLGNR